MTAAKVPPAALLHVTDNPTTAPFWVAASEGRLVCQKCIACGRFRMPPTPFCATCRSLESEFVTLSGRGYIYSFTVVRHPVDRLVADYVPYVVILVELAGTGGARLVGNLVDVEVEDVRIGLEVEVVWAAAGAGVMIPRFRLASA